MSFAETIYSKNLRMVYLWDVTYSMHGGYFSPASVKGQVFIGGKMHTITGYNANNDIYDKVMEALIEDIKQQPAYTDIVVIPFGQRVLDCWKEKSTDEGKAALEEKIRNFCNLKSKDVQGTSISGALEYASENIFIADMPNCLKLLTDGRENYDMPKFYYILDNWCEVAKERNISSYLFELSEEVMKGDPGLRSRIEKSCFTVIRQLDSVKLNVVDEKVYVNLNTESMNVSMIDDFDKPIVLQVNVQADVADKKVPLRFSVVDENPYFELDEKHDAEVGMNEISLKPKYLLSQQEIRELMPVNPRPTYTIEMSVEVDDENIELQHTQCLLTFINQKLVTVEITVEQ